MVLISKWFGNGKLGWFLDVSFKKNQLCYNSSLSIFTYTIVQILRLKKDNDFVGCNSYDDYLYRPIG